MYVHEEKLKDGSVVYRFTYINPVTKKRARLKVSDHPEFKTRGEAEAWARTQTAYESMMKAKVAQRLAWKSKYYNWDELLQKFTEYYKDKATNSWAAAIGALENYVFPYFLQEKNANNANLWPSFFPEFRDWLKQQKSPRGKEQKLAFATQNNIIIALNAFMSWLAEYNYISPENLAKCPAHPEHKLNFRDFEDVISEEELADLLKKLHVINPATADFLQVLYRTGMRFNELFTLPMNYLYAGKMEGSLHEELHHHKIDYYGYIVLESQGAGENVRRNADGSVPRKPLKGRKSMGPRDARTIPIMDKSTWNILAKRFKTEKTRLESNTFGPNKLNYMLFDDLEWNKAHLSLKAAYEALQIEAKSFHSCRHSFTTYLTGKTRSFFLVRSITGHKSRAFERYLHIFEQIALQAKQTSQEIDEVI